MSIILVDTFHHLSSSHSYTETLEQYSVQISQLVSILFVIIATLILYIHVQNLSVIRTIYYATNVISTEAEIFAIRYGLNQAIWLSNIECIIVITNSIHIAKKSLTYLFILIKPKQLLSPRKLGTSSKEIIVIF